MLQTCHYRGIRANTSITITLPLDVGYLLQKWVYNASALLETTWANKGLVSETNSATAEIAKRPFKVTQGHLLLCQSTRHI